MMEDAVHFLSKETVIQAIARSATKVSKFTEKITGPILPICLIYSCASSLVWSNTQQLLYACACT